MKLVKINENQIRCTLTREDLASRELKINELAYGTEKAKTLFRDMMRQANYEFGFEAEDIPLMIEAIPLNAECIVLIITKVENPEELDTRFSRFAPSVTDDYDDTEFDSNEMFDLFRQLQTESDADSLQSEDPQDENDTDNRLRTRVFLIKSLQEVMNAAAVISGNYHGHSTLYKNEAKIGGSDKSNEYLLLLTQGDENNETFDRACNIVSEYGTLQRSLTAGNAYLAEHYEALIQDNAVQVLGDRGPQHSGEPQ